MTSVDTELTFSQSSPAAWNRENEHVLWQLYTIFNQRLKKSEPLPNVYAKWLVFLFLLFLCSWFQGRDLENIWKQTCKTKVYNACV